MKIKYCILVILLFFFHISQSQELEKEYKFSFQLDNRLSSIKDNNITIYGAKIGIQYKHLTRLGIGGSFIANPVIINYFNKKLKLEETNTFYFWYFSLFNDWIIYKKNRWECFFTEQLGFGKPNFSKEINDEIVVDISRNLLLNELSGQVNYKVLPWLGAGAGFGYRNVLNGNSQFKNTMNAPIYILKLIIYPTYFQNKH